MSAHKLRHTTTTTNHHHHHHHDYYLSSPTTAITTAHTHTHTHTHTYTHTPCASYKKQQDVAGHPHLASKGNGPFDQIPPAEQKSKMLQSRRALGTMRRLRRAVFKRRVAPRALKSRRNSVSTIAMKVKNVHAVQSDQTRWPNTSCQVVFANSCLFWSHSAPFPHFHLEGQRSSRVSARASRSETRRLSRLRLLLPCTFRSALNDREDCEFPALSLLCCASNRRARCWRLWAKFSLNRVAESFFCGEEQRVSVCVPCNRPRANC